ncbi:MAG: M23 family metallopeptidase [Rhizobiaceae bacterium]
MQEVEQTIAAELGNEPPLIADGRSGPPDRREISARWLSGTFLTGVTSAVLMGVALLGALDGREQLATPPEIATLEVAPESGAMGEEAKTARVAQMRQVARARDRRRMELSTVSRVGDRDVIRTMPFVHIKMALAAGHTTTRTYPAFDPLTVFAEGDTNPAATGAPALTSTQIYGAKVESEMSLRTIDFPLETADFDERGTLSADEVESVVRATGAELTEGAVQVAALHYVDPQRFSSALATDTIEAPYGVRIVPENMTVSSRHAQEEDKPVYAEEVIPVTDEATIEDTLADSGYGGDDAKGIARGLAAFLGSDTLKEGAVLRVGLEVIGDRAEIVRTSVYDRTTHRATFAANGKGGFIEGVEPKDENTEIATAFDESDQAVRVRGNLPSVYDGIYRAAYSYGMSRDMTKDLVKLLAADVDFQSRLSPADRIDVFISQPDDNNAVSEDSALLYVSATFGGNMRTLYRFQMEDGTVDYFDKDGRSARQFLLRNPVPNGQFRSGFGSRRHPILGYVKMHTGVDWAAPRGTPIIASGNGVVEKAGWSGGYGRQTIIRHANGYETSYNHQSAIAKGIAPGARVRQGQVIGFVGSTGLATGDHLHYELIVNGRKVDPMRVKLPVGRVLKGGDLEAFNRERERIDALLQEDGRSLKVASVDK